MSDTYIHQTWLIPGARIQFDIRSDRPLPDHVFANIGAVVENIESLYELVFAWLQGDDE